ncbi:Cys-tRNA(Pro) deacylase [Shewanella loihica]|uniref:Cys-tRNA(Pro)/Cys-tRNA(Cys) deacylase n=1 Tax=Shewanella loihica (strain ATCC BAA-1088 / PV-4) TaxID=323850 RepID=A3Q8U1_SHELP|nr:MULTISPECIES: Cys-tRNA(Pro) deacylase [Shewanella]ABO21889.1 ybaK/ebsC protein [Shewanella loihica PV-4]QYJ93847.1 Cys-tRNA(Pro) deacylase [Shewanella spartinae]
MTPATKMLDKAKIPYRLHEYQHDANAGAYGLEAAEKLQLPLEWVFKTLVAELDNGTLVVAIIPVDKKLNLKQLAKAAKAKKAAMAAPEKVQRSTGYVLGGVSPIGQKKRLATFIDESAQQLAQIYVSGGRRGLDIELTPTALQDVTQARFVSLV